MIDLTKTGPLSYRELQRINKGLPEESVDNQIRPLNPGFYESTSNVGKVSYTGVVNDWGESEYDSGIATKAQLADYQHYRGVRQSGLEQLGNGFLKMLGTAVTTFIDGTVGLVYGIGTAIAEGRWSGIYDNDVTRAMDAASQEMEKVLPNYYTNQELEGSLWDNLGTANFWGDKVMKTAGFSIGAIYSGGLWTAPLKTAKFVKAAANIFGTVKAAPAISRVAGSTIGGIGEASIEALTNSNDWAKTQIAQLDEMWTKNLSEEYQKKMNEVVQEYNKNKGTFVRGADGQSYDPAAVKMQNELASLDAEFNQKVNSKESDPTYAEALKKIDEDRLKMGNLDFGLNMPILTLSNWIQFGHLFSRGFKTASKARVKGSINDIIGKKPTTTATAQTTTGAERAITESAIESKKGLRGVFSRNKKGSKGVSESTGPYSVNKPFGGRTLQAVKGFFSEGSEEMAQRMASTGSGIYYSSDVNNFVKAQMDPDAEQETISLLGAMSQGITNSLSDDSAWEEFFIGGLMGTTGIPMFRKPKKDGKWRSPIIFGGGAYHAIKDYNEQMRRSEEVINYLNTRVQSPEFLNYYRGLIRHKKYQNDMNKAIQDGDKFNFKNAEHAQLMSDLIMFDEAGKLNDFKSILNEATSTADENLDAIIRNFTSVENGKLVGPFAKFAKLEKDNSIFSVLNDENREELTKIINEKKKYLHKQIEAYEDTKSDLEFSLPVHVDKDQMAELIWMGTQIKNWQDRAKDITPLFREALTNFKTNIENKLKTVNERKSEPDADILEENIKKGKQVDSYTHILNNINELLTLDNEKLANAAMNPKNIKSMEALLDNIYLVNDDLVSNLDIDQVYTLLSDFPKLGKAIKMYHGKLEEYTKDPAKLVEDQNIAKEKVNKEIQDSKKNSLRERLSQAKTISAFKQALREEEDLAIIESTIKDLENEGNEVAKNYRETSMYDSEIRKALTESEEDAQTVQDALKLWENQSKEAENLNQISNTNSVYIDDPNILLDDLENVSESTAEPSTQSNTGRFEKARYALQTAMRKVNDDIRFKNGFSPRVNTTNNESTNNKSINNDPNNNPINNPVNNPVSNPRARIPSSNPVGNISGEAVAEENKEINSRTITPNTNNGQGQRRYYNPTIPELHIEASKEGDFRPFDVVVKEKEGKDYSIIYDYLKKNGAFNYINNGNLKVGDEVGFMIDPAFEKEMSVYDWYQGPTIFFVKGDQVLGDVASLSQAVKYEGLEDLIRRVRDEYQASRQPSTKKIIATYTKADSKGRVKTSEVREVSRTTDREGTVVVKLEEIIISDSENQLSGKKISNGGLKISIDSDIIDWKSSAAGGRRQDGTVITPEQVTNEEEQEVKENMKILLENLNGEIRPFVANTIYYSKDGRIIAKDREGNTIYLKSDPLSPQSHTYDKFEDAAIITLTSQGFRRVTDYQEWSLGVGDIRTSPDGWGEYKGLSYYKRSIGGRKGDNTTIWLKQPITEEGKRKLEEVFNNTGRITDEVKTQLLEIIKDNLEIAIPKTVSNNNKTTSEGRFFATPQTRISKIMVGRIPYSTENRSLADIPGVLDGDTKPVFGIIKNGVLTTNEKIDDRLIIKPVDMSQKEGRLYLLIPNAAGTYSSAAVRVKHFNTQEFNLNDVTVANTSIGKSINEAIDRLASATSQDDVREAMRSFTQDVYSDDILITYFSGDQGEGIAISRKVRKSDGSYETIIYNGEEVTKTITYSIYFSSIKSEKIEINGLNYTFAAAKEFGMDLSLFLESKSTETIRSEILSTLFRLNLPLQVRVNSLNSPEYNSRLINSNILISNLREAKVLSNWFTTDYFDNNNTLHNAENPAGSATRSIPRTNPVTPSTPVEGTESVITGTEVSVGGESYTVDLKSNILTDSRGVKQPRTLRNQNIFDLAWAQETFGDNTESSRMTENKIITPEGKVLDRSTGKYLEGNEALAILDKIQKRNQGSDNKVREANRVKAKIDEDQKKVDKIRTDSEFYYIQEEDGEYYPYDRVHKRIGSNWMNTSTTNSSTEATGSGTIVDKLIRDFFTNNRIPDIPENMQEEAFNNLMSSLVQIKTKMAETGETFYANNIVLFHKYTDGTRIAGEVDILSVTKEGDFKIYDVKTSKYSFYPFTNRRGETLDYFNNKSDKQTRSTKEQYTLQLSAYQNLFESQYGVRPTDLAIVPYVIAYEKVQSQPYKLPKGRVFNLGFPAQKNSTEGYFKNDPVDDMEAMFHATIKDGIIYFVPILDRSHRNAIINTIKSNDTVKVVLDNRGGAYRDSTEFIILEPGEGVIDSNGKIQITKKVKIFGVSPETPYNPNKVTKITSIKAERGIRITYNPAVPVPLEQPSSPVEEALEKEEKVTEKEATEAIEKDNRKESNGLTIFNSSNDGLVEVDTIAPQNAFEDSSGKVGYFVFKDKVHKGIIKKIGGVEVILGSGQKTNIPIHVTKIRNSGLKKGTFNDSSKYIAILPNGKSIVLVKFGKNDEEAFSLTLETLSKNPTRLLSDSLEATPISNEETSKAAINKTSSISQNELEKAARLSQEEDSINNLEDEFEDDLKLREVNKETNERTNTINLEEELAWLEKVLPQLSKEDRLKLHRGLIQVAKNGPVAWGMFNRGIITLSDIAAKGTVYHEAFHAVFNLMLTESEKVALFEEARELYGDKSLLELEEDMAEGFREYVTSKESRGLGRKILDFFKSLFNKITNWKYVRPSLTSYYRVINQGKYKNYSLDQSPISRIGEEEYTPEMQSIKNKAISDGTFMKAPNGNPTNLNERQWLQVRTKNFTNWFGDWVNNPSKASQVVDENGEPLVVYHGSRNTEFTIFDSSKNTKGEKGFFFTNSVNMAKSYGNTRSFFLNIRDPYIINGNNNNWNDLPIRTTDIAKNKLDSVRLHRNSMLLALRNGEISKEIYDKWNDRYYKYLDIYNNLGNSIIDRIKKLIIIRRLNKFKSPGNIIESTKQAESILEYNVNDVNIIFKDIIDYGSVANIDSIRAFAKQESANVYVITDNNNVKSATSNNGNFSTANDDIRYRIIDNNITQMRKETQRFLDNFGITIKEVSEFEGDDLFDALNRVINIRNADDISEGTGYAIAFMMQHSNTMNTLIGYKVNSIPKVIRRSIRNRGDFNSKSAGQLLPEVKQKYLREIGSDIATELRKLYNVEPIKAEPKSFLAKLWDIITEFYDKLTPLARTKFSIIKGYTRNIANSIKLNDPSIILDTDVKPGTTEKAARVDIAEALKENPFERDIIETLNKENIALAGSASIALSGTLYRPSENPLHDLDFNAANYSKEELDTIVKRNFPNNSFIREIIDGEEAYTETYLVLDRPFEIKKSTSTGIEYKIFDKKTGKLLGTFIKSNLTLKNGVQGKFLDFFLGKNNSSFKASVKNINGKPYLIASYKNAIMAKLEYNRPKDIWDYNRFNPNINNIEETKKQREETLKEKLKSARIIWGHPAIGKTTYLERNQDILEWDQEVNSKRDKFIRDRIDPEHKMDVNSKEYKSLRSEYMNEWRSHPEYIKFLTNEWENLKRRAKRENKKLFASPAPLLEIGTEDFDLIINLPEKTFLERNIERGNNEFSSRGWKQIINDALVQIDSNKIITTDKYFSDLIRDTLGVQWGTLTNEETVALLKKGWTEERFNSVSQKERDNAVECFGF